MERKNHKILATGVAALLMTAMPVGALAQSSRQTDKNNMRNLGIGLGGVAVYEFLHGKGTAGLLLGAGAAYAGKKYEDQRKAQNRDNNDRRWRNRHDHGNDSDRRNHSSGYKRTDFSYNAGGGDRNGNDITAGNIPRFPSQSVEVLVNNEKMSFPGNQGAEVIGGNTYVPLRGVLEKLGATVHYDPAMKTVIASKGDKTVKLPYNDDASVNGKPVKLDAPAFITNGQTMVPLRFMAQAFGADVHWNADDHTVHVSSTAMA